MNNILEKYQSGFRMNHSTEPAHLKILNDTRCNLDHHKLTILVLLDLTAAFDTVDHHILLNRLRNLVGLSGTVFNWFVSYLTDRYFFVNMDTCSSGTIHPSIFYTRLIRWSGRWGAGAYPSSHRAKGGVHPGQVACPSQGHTETNNHTQTHSLLRTILETPINLTCMFLHSGRKPEYPEKTHAYMGRTCFSLSFLASVFPHWGLQNWELLWVQLGSTGFTDGGAVLWTALAWVAGAICLPGSWLSLWRCSL